jgi:iodotyrosine deiodinase
MTALPPTKPYHPYAPAGEPLKTVRRFREVLEQRRSVRYFSDRPVPSELIAEIVRAAGTAPSGANKQPWRFVAVADRSLKREIRRAAEEEERAFYDRRAGENWLRDLHPLGTDADKPFLEIAPWLVVVFRLAHDDGGGQTYYTQESVGIAVGMLLAAAQVAGLATLTHTPSPMKFLTKILNRPENERPYLLIPVGYPTDDCVVPDIQRKPLEQILSLDCGSD